MERLNVGEAAAVLADDPLARIDLPHFAASHGHVLLELIDCGGYIRALIRKGGPDSR